MLVELRLGLRVYVFGFGPEGLGFGVTSTLVPKQLLFRTTRPLFQEGPDTLVTTIMELDPKNQNGDGLLVP